MHPALNVYLADALTTDRRRQAERLQRSRVERGAPRPDPFDSVTVRRACSGDEPAIRRLGQLEGRRLPDGPALVAEVRGELLAARSLIRGTAIADPFRPTAHLVELLELRSAHLKEAPAGGTRRTSRRPVALLRGLLSPNGSAGWH